ALATVTVAVDQRVDDLFLGLAVQARALSAVAACPVEDDPALLVSVDRSLHTCHVLLLYKVRICRLCRTLVQAVGADVDCPWEIPETVREGKTRKGSHLPLSLPRSLRAMARSPPVSSWSVDTRRLRAEDLPSNLCWLFTPSRMILPLPVTRMRFLALLFVFCFGIVPFSFAIRCPRQPLATTSHAQTRTDL